MSDGLASESSFNAGWFFRRGGPAEYDDQFDASLWRPVTLPHDWSVEDAPRDPYAGLARKSVIDGEWVYREGDDRAWSEADVDTTEWNRVVLPAMIAPPAEPTTPVGRYCWLRRSFDVDRDFGENDLMLVIGVVTGSAEVFVNGTRIGGMDTFPWSYVPIKPVDSYHATQYVVPAQLLKQTGNIVAVRVYSPDQNLGILAASIIAQADIVSGPFSPRESEGGVDTGFVLGGLGWYRKEFALDPADAGKAISLIFDGVYGVTDIWINGSHLCTNYNGYAPIRGNIDRFLKPAGQPNVVLVRVRNHGKNSRWYSGSGMYRDVTLVKQNAVHFPTWSLFAWTKSAGTDAATIDISGIVRNTDSSPRACSVVVTLTPFEGVPAAETRVDLQLAAGGTSATADIPFNTTLTISAPRLWSPEEPSLYRLEAVLIADGRASDYYSIDYGIRTVEIDGDAALRLNGQVIKLRGGCIHHDNGPLGAISLRSAEERRITLLKQNGYNAIRTSHNPPSRVLLEVCDRLGMLVMDEAFDMWEEPKTPDDYHRYFADTWQDVVDAMVLRDRNHQCVIMWSTGNEIPERYKPIGPETNRKIAERMRSLDPTRPITNACNEVRDEADALFAPLDIRGYNYAVDRYVGDHERDPKRPIVATESFPNQIYDYWKAVEDHPWVIGDFIWTAMDYIGESGIGWTIPDRLRPHRDFLYLQPYPWHLSNCGDLDICGFKKPQSYYRDVLWGLKPIEILVNPTCVQEPEAISAWGWTNEYRSWNWEGMDGAAIRVNVYTRMSDVQLFLNGERVDSPPVFDGKMTHSFLVPYTAGELRAVATSATGDGASISLATTGATAYLRVTASASTIGTSEHDLSYISVEAVDENGNLVPNEDREINFDVVGEGSLIAVANGDPVDVSSFHANSRRLFQGRCLAIARSNGKPGDMTITATSHALPPERLSIRVV